MVGVLMSSEIRQLVFPTPVAARRKRLTGAYPCEEGGSGDAAPAQNPDSTLHLGCDIAPPPLEIPAILTHWVSSVRYNKVSLLERLVLAENVIPVRFRSLILEFRRMLFR